MDYTRYMHRAFRQVVHDILQDAARDGLAGESHYFITFRTADAGVEVPDFLRARYPHEMSIVLQNQFSDLRVSPDFFAVRLSFGGMPATVKVPYAAIKVFADPAAQFALTFEPPPAQRPSAEIIDLESMRKK